MDLKTISSDKLLSLLNEETIELLVRSYLNRNKGVIAWLRYIDRVFDNISNIGPDGKFIRGDYTTLRNSEIVVLYDFADLFPQFVTECKYDTKKLYDYLDNKIKDENHIHINTNRHRVVYKRSGKYYTVSTYEISDSIVNYKIIAFFPQK
jgi:hypothetical protein